MAKPDLSTVRDLIAWSYANLACAHAALSDGRVKHVQTDWMIRAKLFRGLRDGRMKISSLFDDERIKLVEHPACAYCGSDGKLSIDHLIPRAVGGDHSGHNLVRACRSCNSSKGKRDLLSWYDERGRFPPLLLLRRYMKLVAIYCEAEDLLDLAICDTDAERLPFELAKLPTQFPPLGELKLR